MNKSKKYEELPILDTNNCNLSSLDKDKSKEKLIRLVNNDVIFELWNEDKTLFQMIPGKLLEYKGEYLTIHPHDYTSCGMFDTFDENISINRIRGIEQIRENNLNIKFIDEFKNNICTITDRDDKTITVLITDYDNFDVLFNFKYKDKNDICIGEGSYPLCLLKDIKIVESN